MSVTVSFTPNADQDQIRLSIYKNGAAYKESLISASSTGLQSVSVTIIADANGSTDYFEVFAADLTTASTVDGDFNLTYFTGCRIG